MEILKNIPEALFPNSFDDFESFYRSAQLYFRHNFKEPKNPEPLQVSGIALGEMINKGTFGTVFFGTRGGVPCTIKMTEKITLDSTERSERSMAEIILLGSITHPSVVTFMGYFEDNSHMYIVTKTIVGGALDQHLRIKKRFSESESRQIIAQIVLVLEYLHRLSVVHRNIQTANVLLDERGYVKVADFGFAKFLDGITFTFLGTPEYMAPEILSGRGYTSSVDWWALGVLTYELHTGHGPFEGSEILEIISKIRAMKMEMPKYFSKELTEFVSGLLTSEVDRRLGCGRNTVDKLKSHNFFSGIDWWSLFQQKLAMEYIPMTGLSLINPIS
ncbi:hypothetical protein ACOME3_002720 [Neoechinorhynchus agilis]